ncbi:IclR family transcriptional regulator domain-containing protein [Nocardia grenadensis]|uniref:IclR family transcriptional regulator domain-containing protein n=1 Tax=Nocardia grenadensis TaxID=931537 RepID=UPI003D7414FB
MRRAGFALNDGLSERGVVAVGVPVRDAGGTALAGLSVSMPSVRYRPNRLPTLVATLHRVAGGIEASRGDL